VKTRRVPYTKRERYWVPKIVQEQRFVRNREIEHRDPIYGWRDEKHGTKMASVTKTVPKWMPVGKEEKWELENLPSPTPTPTPTPYPIPATPYPLPVETPELNATSTPMPVSIPAASAHLSGEDTALFGSIAKWTKKVKSLWNAGGLAFKPLPSGHYSVSAPGQSPGDKLDFRQGQGYAGTRYTVGGLANTTTKELLGRAAKGIAFSLGISIGVNIYDYGIGEHSDKGIISNEFAASTAVDFTQAGLTGLAAAGIASAIVIGAAAASITVPLLAALGLATVLGVAIGYVVDKVVDTDKLKQQVADGFGTFPGILKNAGTIVSVGAERVGEAVVDTVQEVGEVVSNIVSNANNAIAAVAQDVTNTVSGAVQNTAVAFTGFVGNILGGND
jgi:hypothetical protein